MERKAVSEQKPIEKKRNQYTNTCAETGTCEGRVYGDDFEFTRDLEEADRLLAETFGQKSQRAVKFSFE